MRVLIIGSLAGELGRAARRAAGRGARVCQADHVADALVQLRADAGQEEKLANLINLLGQRHKGDQHTVALEFK